MRKTCGDHRQDRSFENEALPGNAPDPWESTRIIVVGLPLRSRRVVKRLSWLEVGSVKMATCRPTAGVCVAPCKGYPPVCLDRLDNPAGRDVAIEYFCYLRHANQKDNCLPIHLTSPRLYQRWGRVRLSSTTINLN